MNPTLPLAVLTALAAAMPAQMEKRDTGGYDEQTFLDAAPRVGDEAPDLLLCDMDGRPRSLHLLRGATVVLVKGSYT
jgi:hypothetical protein